MSHQYYIKCILCFKLTRVQRFSVPCCTKDCFIISYRQCLVRAGNGPGNGNWKNLYAVVRHVQGVLVEPLCGEKAEGTRGGEGGTLRVMHQTLLCWMTTKIHCPEVISIELHVHRL